MRVLTLRLQGFRSHADTTVDFPSGCVSVIGANGSGKSSILTGLDVALFGAEGRSLAPYLSDGANRMVLDLLFEHGGDQYKIRRELLNGKTVLDFGLAADGQVIEPLTAETVAATQERIEETLGFTRRTLRASSLLMQADAGAFVEAEPKQRKEILAEVLGLDLYGRLADLVRADRRALETEITTAEGSIGVLREQAADVDELRGQHVTLAEAREALAGEAATLRAALVAARSAHAELDRQAAARVGLVRDLAQAEQTCAELRRRDIEHGVARERIDQARTTLASLEGLAAEHGWLVGRLAELEQAGRARTLALQEKAQLEAHLTEIRAATAARSAARDGIDAKIRDWTRPEHAAVCDRCERELDDESRAVAVASLDQEKAAIDTELESLAERVGLVSAQLDELTIPDVVDGLDEARARMIVVADAPAKLAAARARIEELERQVDPGKLTAFQVEFDQAEAALVAAEKALADSTSPTTEALEELAATITTTERAVDQLEARERETADELARTAERLATAEKAAERVAEIEATTSLHRGKAVLLEQLERAYGPNGIPMLLMENHAIPHIEAEANRVLVALGGQPASWSVELRTQAEKKTGGLKDALDVVVHTGPGEERDYRSLSGGERTRVAVALRLGVARLLANRAGADCQLLALDEPDALDTAGKAALVDVLHDLADTYSCVLLITHDTDLQDRFDTTITVELDSEGRSRVSGLGSEVAA